MRKDYNNIFQEFQNALFDFCNDSKHINDERRLVEVFQRMDHEVNKLNTEYSRIQRAHKSMSIYFGVLCLIPFILNNVDSVLQSYLNTLISGMGLYFVKTFYDYRDLKEKIDKDPFYFPFKISKEFQ
jgi:hypothetical protein